MNALTGFLPRRSWPGWAAGRFGALGDFELAYQRLVDRIEAVLALGRKTEPDLA